VGEDMLFFTTDGGWGQLVEWGPLAEPTLATVDFGPGIGPAGAFALQRKANGGQGSLASSECYTGWFDH